MKRIFIWLLFALNAWAAAAVHAETSDTEKATAIQADSSTYDDIKQVLTYNGNVTLTRGTLTIKADKIVVTKDPAGYQYAKIYAAPNGVATFRQKRNGPGNLWFEGQAQRIEYDDKTEVVKLLSNALIRRLDGNRPTDEMQGEFISYDSRTEFVSVNNSPSGQSKPGAGRVKAVIHPRSEQKDKQ
ncbi:MAG TPA: lipopolysaccharide transport periplasmic protein LptA [Paucimonas sp.]|nr:lipopolysaccharide transport periplasmic protein LptA [Paucimonas sp.]